MADVKFEVVRAGASTAAAPTTQDFTIPGFGTPKGAIFIHSEANSSENGAAVNIGRMCIGFTDGVNEWCTAFLNNHNQGTSAVSRYHSDAAVVISPSVSATVNARMMFNSWITDGVRVDIDDNFSEAEYVTVILIGGSDVSNVHVGNTNLGTGTSAIDVTSPGFEPDLALFSTICDNTTPPGGGQFGNLSFGAWVNDGSDTQRCAILQDRDNRNAADCDSYIGNTAVAAQVGTTGSVAWTLSCGSADASGFSLTPSSNAGSDRVGHLAIAFTGAPDFVLKDTSIPTSGDFVDAGLGFAPDFTLMQFTGNISRNSAQSNDVEFAISAFDGSTMVTTSVTSEHGADPTVCKSMSADSLKLLDGDGATTKAASSAESHTASGWSHTLSTNPPTAVLGWVFAIGAAAGSAVAFSGPVPTQTEEIDGSTSIDLASYFSGTETPFTYSLQAGTLPTGLSLNTSTGVISGTPTTIETRAGIVVRATDQNSDTADTNAFTIDVVRTTTVAPDDFDSALGTGSVANPTTSTPTITLTPDDQADVTGWLMGHWRIPGVLNKTPNFETSFSSFRTLAALPADPDWEVVWRYLDDTDPGTGRMRTWTKFANGDAVASPHGYSHSAAFTQDVIEVAIKPRWRYLDTVHAIAYLEGHASGYAYELPSSIAAGGTKHVHDTCTFSGTPQNSAAATTLNLYGIGLEDAGVSPDGGREKLDIAIFPGMHSSEDQGSMAAWAFAYFFVESASAEAAWLRKNTRLAIYDVNPSGRYYGKERWTEEATDEDPNRAWDDTNSDQVESVKAALALDSSDWDILFDFHGSYRLNGNELSGLWGLKTDVTHAVKTDFVGRFETLVTAAEFEDLGVIPAGSAEEYGDDVLNCQLSLTLEHAYASDGYPSQDTMFTGHAQNIASILEDMLVAGELHQAGPVSSDLHGLWNIDELVARDTQLPWHIAELINADAGIPWHIRATAGNSLQLPWNIAELVTADNQLPWSIAQQVSSDAQLLWNLHEIAGADSQLLWDILSLSSVGANLQVLYNITESVTADSQLAWHIRETIGNNAQLLWTLLETVGADNQLQWHIREQVQRDAQLLWNILEVGIVGADLSTPWNILESVGSDLHAPWQVLATVANDAHLLYHVTSLVGADLAAPWDINQLATADLSVRWNLLSEVITRILTENSGNKLIHVEQANTLTRLEQQNTLSRVKQANSLIRLEDQTIIH